MTMFRKTLSALLSCAMISQVLTQECNLCAGISDTPDLNPGPSPFDPKGQVDCNTLNTQRTSFTEADSQCTDIQLAAFQGGCCNSPPYGKCSICATGDAVSTNKVETGAASPPSCGEYSNTPFAYYPSDNVGSCAETRLRRVSFMCGCQGAEQECGLCDANGGVAFPDPGNPSLRDNLLRNESCRSMVFTTLINPAATCDSKKDIYGVDYAGFCRCPGTTEPTDPTCSICEDGQKERDGDTIIASGVKGPDGQTRDLKCSEAYLLAKFITNPGVCQRLSNNTRAACCKSSASALKMASSLFLVGSAVVALLF